MDATLASLMSRLTEVHLNLEEYFGNPQKVDRVRRELVLDSLRFHVRANAAFRAYCGRSIGSDAFGTDIFERAEMPLIPSSVFKRRDITIRSTADEVGLKYCVSSGTSGSVSRVPRDEGSLLNFVSSITATLPALLGLHRTGDHHGIVLGPPTEQAGDLWFAYVTSSVNLNMRALYCQSGRAFRPELAAAALARALRRNSPFLLLGPPARILEVCDLLQNGESVPQPGEHCYVLSAGGWKSAEQRAIAPAEFRAKVTAALALDDESRVRDCFNMVELNTCLLECEYHQKHIPPWLLAQARDPGTGSVLPDGEVGVLSYMDAGALSYPCFLLSDDLGSVDSGICRCGRAGGTLRILRRINRLEQRGCALKMATLDDADGRRPQAA